MARASRRKTHPPAQGCALGLLGAARLALACAPMLMGATVGRWLQRLAAPASGTPYDGALLVALVGLAMGLALATRGQTSRDWRGAISDVALCLVALVWLLGVALRATDGIPWGDVAAAYAAALGGAAVVAGLSR